MSTRVAELLEAEDFSAAAAAFASSPNPGDAELLFEALDQLDRDDTLEQLEASLAIAEALVGTSPKRDDAHHVVIECLRKTGRAADAIAFAAQHASRPALRREHYQLLCLHGRLDEAAAVLPSLAGLDAQSGAALYNLGTRLHPQSPATAAALYRGAVLIGSPVPQAHINLGLALLAQGKAAEAAESARAGLAKHPSDANLLANAIDAGVRVGDRSGLRTLVATAANVIAKGCRQCGGDAVASCQAGCAALLEDMTNAWIFLGDDRSAVMAIEAACGEAPPTPRVRYALARALAAGGSIIDATSVLRGKRPEDAPETGLTAAACLALMEAPPSVADAASFYAYRAQAAVAWANGEPERAAGALCAALFLDPGARDQLAQDASWAALRGREPAAGPGAEPLRPPGLAEEAWWDGSDKEWVLGPRDKQDGDYKYFRPDGSCCNHSTLVDGKPHGPFLRFHENGEISQQGAFDRGELHGTRRWNACDEATTEHTRQDGMSLEIWASEIDYAHGRVVEIRHYDRAGNQCAPDGTRYPARPAGVDARAAYYPEKKHWRCGEVDNEGKKRGVWRTWNEHGRVVKEESYRDDELHGPYRAFYDDGSVAAEGEYADGSQEGLFTYLRQANPPPPPVRAAGDEGDEDDDEDDDGGDSAFPMAGARVVKIEQLDGRRRYFDKQGRETLLDGRPLEEVQRDPFLGPWLADLEKVSWSQLESAGGSNPPGFALLSALIAEDEGGHEKLSDHAYGGLYWHFCHQGTVYSGTAAAVPFLVRLLERKQQPHRLALFNFLRSVGGAMRGTYQRARAEGPDEGWADFLAVAETVSAGYPVYRRLLDDADPKVRAWAARLLGSCHGHAEPAARALSYRLINERDPGVRGNLLQSIGNLGGPGADHMLRRSLDKGGLEQISAAIAMVMCKGDEAGIETVSALVGALGEAHAVQEAFDAMPWSELDIYAELANTFAQTGRGAGVLDDILARLDQVDPLSSISICRAALVIAKQLQGDDDDDDDDDDENGDGGAALRKVMRAIAAAEVPWRLNVNLHEVLEEHELPTDRDELAAAGAEQEDRSSPGGAVDHDEDEDDDSEDGDDGDDGDDGWSDDDDSDDDSGGDDDSEDDDDSDDDGSDSDDDGGHRTSAVTSVSTQAASGDDFTSEISSHTTTSTSARPAGGLGRRDDDSDLDDEIDRSLGLLDDLDPSGHPRVTDEMAIPDLAALDPSADASPDLSLDPGTRTTTAAATRASSEGFLENELPPDHDDDSSERAGRAFARPGSDAWLSDVRKSDTSGELDIAELGSIDADLEDEEGKPDDDGWNN